METAPNRQLSKDGDAEDVALQMGLSHIYCQAWFKLI